MTTSDNISQREMPVVPGVRHRFVRVGDAQVHIAECGDGDPVLLLHSFPQHWYAWRRVIPLLASDYLVICPDFPGFGWSESSPDGYDTRARAAAVLGIMDSLGLERARVIGHAWGAIAGFRICLESPERVSHFLALNAAHPWPLRRAAVAEAWRQWHTAFWEYPGVGRQVLRHWPAFTRFMLRHWAAGPSALPPEAITEYVESSRDKGHAKAGEELNWQYVVHDIPGLLRRKREALTVPTVIIAGERDVVIPPRLCRSGSGDASEISLVVAQGAGHLLPEERPELVAETARDLFSRQ
jgi:pimeloyl-ACP methyl ester carboxylesterase